MRLYIGIVVAGLLLHATSGQARARDFIVTDHPTIQTLDWISQRLLEGEPKALAGLDPMWSPILKKVRRDLLHAADKAGEPSTVPRGLAAEDLVALASKSQTVVVGRIVSIEPGVSLLPLRPACLVTIRVTENLRSDDDHATPNLIQAIVSGGVAIVDGSRITAKDAIPLPVLDPQDQVILLGRTGQPTPAVVTATSLLRVRANSVDLPGEARGVVSLESIRAVVFPEGGEKP